MADQEWFAALSSDRNPIHIDPMAARRSPFGRCVVHGLHLVLWSLDELCRQNVIERARTSIKADFIQPCLVGEEATIVTAGERDGVLRVEVMLGTPCLPESALRPGRYR